MLAVAGTFDTTFDSDGRNSVDWGGWDDAAKDVIWQASSNKLIVAGYNASPIDGPPNYAFAFARFKGDGTLDPTWTAKTYLVPFVEGIPFRPILGPILEGKKGALRWLAGGFTPGARGVVLPAAGTKVGATICFERSVAGRTFSTLSWISGHTATSTAIAAATSSVRPTGEISASTYRLLS